jgi:aspartyl-tRNA(Asn)/glutamyl-tRNA(Gln) amidotransferase subunit B
VYVLQGQSRDSLVQKVCAAHDEIRANPDKAAAVAEKPQSLGWFVGQVMKSTGGKANPAAVNDILKAKLGL